MALLIFLIVYSTFTIEHCSAQWIQGGGFNGGNVLSLAASENNVFAGTYGQSEWHRPISEFIGIQNISIEIPSEYSLGQNYPNPFNPMCNVQFSMCNAGNVKIVVYDVMGREVQTLVNERLRPERMKPSSTA